MNRRRFVYVIVIAALTTAGLVSTTPGASARGGGGKPLEITATARGAELVQSVAKRFADQGFSTDAGRLHAWELGPDEVIVGESLPANLRSSVTTSADGKTRVEVSWDVGVDGDDAGRVAGLEGATAATPSWQIASQGCLAWMRSLLGELLSCYKVRRLVDEAFPREYYSLEQYGTVQALFLGKIYDGWVAAVRAPNTPVMAWEDWDPLGDLVTNNCMIQPLSISVLGTGFSTSGLLCERWDMTLYNDGGHFKQLWSCGCIYPFGQPYPNSRGMRYVQGISVSAGNGAWWTLSAGFLAL